MYTSSFYMIGLEKLNNLAKGVIAKSVKSLW
jgi:hypothetical protein